MPYRRRQQDAAHAFAWPPTREDLDLIEVVDADTLRPVHAQYNEPEAAQPVQLDLLKSVTPVRPVRTPLPMPVHTLDTPPPAAPLVIVHSSSLVPPQRQPPASALARVPMPSRLPFPRRRRIDPNWLVATCGMAAIALSAYLSLRPANSTVDVESVIATPVNAATPPRLAARPLSALELSWWPPATAQRVPSTPSTAKPKPAPKVAKKAAPPAVARAAGIRAADSRGASKKTGALAAARPAPAIRTIEAVAAPPLAARAAPATIEAKPLASATVSPASSTVRDAAPAPISSPSLDSLPAAATRSVPAATPVPVPEAGRQLQQQMIYAALHEYEKGYERLDANAVRAVWPSVDARALARAFHDLKSQTLVFDRCEIDVARVQAVAACRGRATYATRAGEQALRTEPREWTFKLRKSDEAWQIVSASAR